MNQGINDFIDFDEDLYIIKEQDSYYTYVMHSLDIRKYLPTS